MGKEPWKVEFVSEPCRNFCIFASTVIHDPKDGKDKYVLSNFSDGGLGFVVLIDPEDGTGETIPLPGDEGAWAILNYQDEKLLVGTCANFGYIHALDLKSRTWLSTVRDPAERYVWNFTLGSDGMVYGGTWPGCALFRYDPKTMTLKNFGKTSIFEENMYCRPVVGTLPGYILMTCGYEKTHAAVLDLATDEIKPLGRPGGQIEEVTADTVCIAYGDKKEYFNARLEPMDAPAKGPTDPRPAWMENGIKCVALLPGGKTAGVRGQEYFVTDNLDEVPEFKRIPGEAPATTIMTILAADDGSIWGSTALGQTIFRFDPATGDYWNSPQVCNNGGEVYGMRFLGGKLFLSSYCGGDHVVYDPAAPWDQFRNQNPKTLQSVGPDLIRPTGKSVIGPDGNFWTGWSAKYGMFGGGLSCVDADTLEVRSWYDPIPAQQIAGLAADDRVLYFTTNGDASGCDTKVEPFHLCVWDIGQCRIVWQRTFANGDIPGAVSVSGDSLLVALNNSILIYDRATMTQRHALDTGAFCTCLLDLGDGRAVAFCGKTMFLVDPQSGNLEATAEVPGRVETAAVDTCGVLYFACGSKLYRLSEKLVER